MNEFNKDETPIESGESYDSKRKSELKARLEVSGKLNSSTKEKMNFLGLDKSKKVTMKFDDSIKLRKGLTET